MAVARPRNWICERQTWSQHREAIAGDGHDAIWNERPGEHRAKRKDELVVGNTSPGMKSRIDPIVLTV